MKAIMRNGIFITDDTMFSIESERSRFFLPLFSNIKSAIADVSQSVIFFVNPDISLLPSRYEIPHFSASGNSVESKSFTYLLPKFKTCFAKSIGGPPLARLLIRPKRSLTGLSAKKITNCNDDKT